MTDTDIIINTLREATPLAVFVHALLVVQLAMLVSLIAGVIALIVAIARRSQGGRRSALLATLGGSA